MPTEMEDYLFDLRGGVSRCRRRSAARQGRAFDLSL